MQVRLPSGLLVAGVLCLGVLVGGCSSAATPTPPPGSSQATAERIFRTLVAAQEQGHVSAAAWVESTFGEYQAIQSPEERHTPAGASPSDKVIVVKLYGQFPNAHSGPKDVNKDANVIVQCYDLALETPLETIYYAGPEPADIPAAPMSSGETYLDLRKLGTPALIHP
ncbi:MAG: hypothetical protein ABSE70_10050 [Candidatus Limnocylindrales bacterium]